MRQLWTLMTVVILATTAWQQVAVAQPFTLDEDIVSLQLTLRDYPDGNGLRWATAEGEFGTEVQYLHVGGLSARSATEVFLLAIGVDRQATLGLAKDNWSQNLKQCTTDHTGTCSVQFKTHNDVGFKVSGDEGASWQLVVLTSAEVPVATLYPSPLYAAERENETGVTPDTDNAPGADSNTLLIGTVVGLLVILVILLLLLLKKKTGTAAVAFLLVFYGLVGANKEATAAVPRVEPTSYPTISALEGVWGEGFGRLMAGVATLDSATDLVGTWTDLSACSELANPPNMPRIPSFCEGDRECAGCYDDARSDFEANRSDLEQLRTIYQCTKKFTDSAIAFGDNASGIHAVTGLTWQVERIKINKSVESLQKAYDQKFGQLSGQLHTSMMDISACEARFGEPDWYDRFGYMYFEFMRDKYKRAD